MKGYQFVWSKPFMLGVARLKGSIGCVYRWVLFVGWLEIRRWAK